MDHQITNKGLFATKKGISCQALFDGLLSPYPAILSENNPAQGIFRKNSLCGTLQAGQTFGQQPVER
jgi:hypothetical protein